MAETGPTSHVLLEHVSIMIHLLGGRWALGNFTTKCQIVLQIGSNYKSLLYKFM